MSQKSSLYNVGKLTPKSGLSALNEVKKNFLLAATRYYTLDTTAREQQHGESESKQSASGTGQNSVQKVSAGAANSSGKRNGQVASVRAVATRNAKYGDTKLKPATLAAAKASGASVGSSAKLPLRSGQNRNHQSGSGRPSGS